MNSNTITERILKKYKLKFPFTKKDLVDLIASAKKKPAYSDFKISNFVRVFKSMDAIEER